MSRKGYRTIFSYVRASGIVRGRTLNINAVKLARRWRAAKLKGLLARNRLSLTKKEIALARQLTGRWDFWNYDKGVDDGYPKG